MRYGTEGYGVYFAIIERLQESKDYIHVKDYSIISFDLRVKNEIIKAVIEDFGLFDWTEDGTDEFRAQQVSTSTVANKDKP